MAIRSKKITGIYINDRDIKNMVIGNGPEIATRLEQTYEFSLEQAKTKSDIYQVIDVSQGYALIVTDKDNNVKWTFTAFDNDGKLSADQIFGSEPRYLIMIN